jgi:hypothetical protein
VTAPREPRVSALGWIVGLAIAAVNVVGVGFAIYRLTGEEEPALTIEDRLAQVEGRTLTPAEVTELLGVGRALCELDEGVLDELWRRLDESQLEFQDFVFAYLCPERSVLYAAHTGRYVTQEARDSGVEPSTTRPAAATSSSTAVTHRTTSTTATSSTADDPTTSGDGSPGGEPTPTSATATTATSPSPSPGGSTVTLDPGLGAD